MFMKGYANIIGPLFDLINNNSTFQCTPQCQMTFDKLKQKLLQAPILTKLNFLKLFILDID